MKILNKIIIALLLFCCSCSGWLDIEPENDLIQQEYWKSKGDIEATLTGGYYTLTQSCSNFFLWGELRGDMLAVTTKTSSSYEQIMTNIIVDNSNVIKWTNFYKAINYANNVIQNVEKVKQIDLTFTDDECKAYLAEAYFIRSLSYFYLVRAFKDVPFITEPSVHDGQNYDVPKSDELTILNTIIDDLEEYKLYAKVEFDNVEFTKGRATQGAIHALLADLYLWRGSLKDGIGQDGKQDYEQCVQACELVRGLSYSLVDRNNWFSIFYPGNSSESIFELQFDKTQGSDNGLLSLFSKSLNYHFMASTSLEGLYGINQSDIRGNGSTYLMLEDGTTEIWKYVGTRTTTSNMENRRSDDMNDNHWIFYRLPDIYLMEAEARLLINPNDVEATNLLKSIKERAAIVPGDWVTNLYEVLSERQREFAYEGKRWFDLLRYAKRSEEGKRMILNILLASVSATDRPFFEAKYNDLNSCYFPIHIDELKENPKLEQNPFYKY